MKTGNRNPGRNWFHAAALAGLGATVYTNYRAAPSIDLQVAYLMVPVLLAGVSEGLIRAWRTLPRKLRGFGVVALFLLVATSYEHLRSLTVDAHGTWFAANVGSGVIDLAIFVCVLATCVLTPQPETGNGNRKPEADIPTVAPVPETIPEIMVSVPETVLIPVPVSGLAQAVDVAVPEFTAPPETDAPYVPEHVRIPEPDWFGEVPVSPAPVSPAPTSGARAAKLATDLTTMEALFGQKTPTATEIMGALKCGGSRATRLREAYVKHLEQTENDR